MDAEGWNRRYAEEPKPFGVEPNVFLAELVGGLQPGHALDMACGDGRNAIWLASRGWQVMAVDFSDVAIESARRSAVDAGVSVDYQVHDLTTWRPPSRLFDLVAIVNLHTQREQFQRIMSRASDAVARGGTLFVVGHHLDNLEDGVGGPRQSDVLYTEADLVEWSELDVVSAQRTEREVETESGSRTAVDALLVARR